MRLEAEYSEESESPIASLTWDERALRFLQSACDKLDQRHFLPLYAAGAVYLFVVIAWSTRPLWYDELFTYYIAKSATLQQFISLLSNWDLNPPLQAGLTILAFRIFGDGSFATRLPSIVAFSLASLFLFQFVSRRLGQFYGLTAMLAFWTTDFLRYASEARPYALIAAFFGLTMVSWQRVLDGRGRKLGLIGISVGIGGVLMSHVLGSLTLLALGAAEFYRVWKARKPDWGVWIAFVAPAPLLFVYLPMVSAYHQTSAIYPAAFQASLQRAITFFPEVLAGGSFSLLVAIAFASLIGAREATNHNVTPQPGLQPQELALCLSLLAIPLIINLFLMRAGGAFWPRYAIGAGMGISVLFAQALAKAARGSRTAGAVSAGVLLAGIFLTRIVFPAAQPLPVSMTKTLSLQDLDANLPLVAASGVTFLEMDKREDAEFAGRLNYLTDERSARQYAHATIFEGFPSLRQAFPVRANVTPYETFIRQSPHFLVVCTLNFPEDWLIAKLLADRAELRLLGEMNRGYKDTMVFDVRVAGPPL